MDYEVWNGRLLNPPAGEQKGHNIGSTKGMLFKPKDNLNQDKPLYLTEGAIDALSFETVGEQAWSYLSAQNVPDFSELYRQYPNIKIVLAPDNDLAGKKSVPRLKSALKDAGFSDDQIKCIAPPKGKDWNDLLQEKKLEGYLQSDYPRWESNLLLAKNIQEYAELLYQRTGRVAPILYFDGCTYGCKVQVPKSKGKKAAESSDEPEIQVHLIGEFVMTLVRTINEMVSGERTFRYVVEVLERGQSKPTRVLLTPQEMTVSGEIMKALMSKANVFCNPKYHMDSYLNELLAGKDKMLVRKLTFFGQDSETGAYVTPASAYYQNRLILPEDGVFKIGGEYLSPHAIEKGSIAPAPCDIPIVYGDMVNVFGDTGRAAITWVATSLLVREWAGALGFFPFMSLVGAASTGKSTLSLKLSAMRGFDFEGHPFNKHLCTPKGIQRMLAQYSGTHVTLLEGKEGEIPFDPSIFLPLFNLNQIGLRGQCTSGNETNSFDFLATIMFIQNAEFFEGEAQKSRVISLPFYAQERTPQQTLDFKKFAETKPSDYAWLGVQIMEHREAIMKEWLPRYQKMYAEWSPQFKIPRVAQIHAFLGSAYNAIIRTVLKWDNTDISPFLLSLAIKKQEQCSEVDDPMVCIFADILKDILADNNGERYIRSKVWEGERVIAVSTKIREHKAFSDVIKDITKLRSLLKKSGHYVHSTKVRFGEGVSQAWLLRNDILSDADDVEVQDEA